MKGVKSLNLIIFVSTCIVISNCLPNWVKKGIYCGKEDDCPLGYCCVIGFTRYSVPQCMPFGEMGNWCRLYNEPENKTLAFPNGEYYEFTRIYTQFCPCNKGFICSEAKCVPSSENMNFETAFFDDY